MSRPDRLIRGVHHVVMSAQDPNGLMRFLEDAADFRPVTSAWVEQVGSPVLAAPNLYLVVRSSTQAPVHRPVSESGLAHLCLQTPDIHRIVDGFGRAGATFHCPPIDLGTGFLYCYARDIECNVMEIECVPPVWPEAKPWVAHVNVITHDLRRLSDFYSRLLETEAIRSPRLRDDKRLDQIAALDAVELRAAWLDAGNVQIELMQYHRPASTEQTGRRDPGGCGYRALAFEVRDLGAAAAHLLACGGTWCPEGPAAPDVLDGLDPDGNPLRLIQTEESGTGWASVGALSDPHVVQRFTRAREALSSAA